MTKKSMAILAAILLSIGSASAILADHDCNSDCDRSCCTKECEARCDK